MEIHKNTIAEAWETGIMAILENYKQTGKKVVTERDTSSIELENIVFRIDAPLLEKRISDLYPNPTYLKTYINKILDFKYQKDVYSRMICNEYNNSKINQLDKAKQKLLDKWYTSKAIINVWDQYIDISSDHPPCTCLIQFFVREKKLNMTAYFRSNDAWLCSLGDMIALTNLQKDVSNDIGLEVGSYTHFACCYHIYEYDIQAAVKSFS